MRVIILGAGLVGKAMALDLAAEPGFEITAVDFRGEPLEELARAGVAVVRKDLSRPAEVSEAVRDYELVINALPGFLGFQTLKACLESGKNVVDIAFFPEDPFELDSLAKEKGVTAVVDCGVAPGLSHMLAAYGLNQLDRGRSLLIYVGGLPVVRQWPFEYKAVFSPYDVIEEYLRPARFRENGHLVIKPALSDPEFIEFEKLGTLEAFNTDGLRTLLKTLDVPNMKEKTLRYPGHREKMAILKEAGFFGTEPVEISGQRIRPIDFTAKVLFSRLKLNPGEEDLTVMRVMVSGEKSGQNRTLIYDLFDRFDRKTGIHSMARTTGYTATMVARAMARGLIKKTGVVAPEYLGFDRECLKFVVTGLKNKGLSIEERIETI
ncbi:MAG: saccharopine dehydrogenase NADP-binding domain-containing protein [Candidatus Aminicenantes bacterium]|nr:saccharopine dehydrogenase NADP-binding domain-containing protein [Candidatus Aminicenantes bacterium]